MAAAVVFLFLSFVFSAFFRDVQSFFCFFLARSVGLRRLPV